MSHRPLRPYFYKKVAILGVPLRDWRTSLIATVFCAICLYFTKLRFVGIPVWFVLSILIGFGLVSFFLWAHNTHHDGWIEYSARYWFRQLTGIGHNLLADHTGRRRVSWLTDAKEKQTNEFKWLL